MIEWLGFGLYILVAVAGEDIVVLDSYRSLSQCSEMAEHVADYTDSQLACYELTKIIGD